MRDWSVARMFVSVTAPVQMTRINSRRFDRTADCEGGPGNGGRSFGSSDMQAHGTADIMLASRTIDNRVRMQA